MIRRSYLEVLYGNRPGPSCRCAPQWNKTVHWHVHGVFYPPCGAISRSHTSAPYIVDAVLVALAYKSVFVQDVATTGIPRCVQDPSWHWK